jgi:hypothetical protein
MLGIYVNPQRARMAMLGTERMEMDFTLLVLRPSGGCGSCTPETPMLSRIGDIAHPSKFRTRGYQSISEY